jgi:hypothetical protein
MKVVSLIAVAGVASTSAFVAPMSNGRVATPLFAEKKPTFFDTVFGMDLFAPNKQVNDYGSRGKKNLALGKIQEGKSYIPNGLTAAQYEKVRSGEKAKKDANYARNVAKAGKFKDYTEFYIKRGTDTNEDWSKSVTKGHDMVKTKYDWSGKQQDAPLWAKIVGKNGKK